jgi:predicted aminopeptidase
VQVQAHGSPASPSATGEVDGEGRGAARDGARVRRRRAGEGRDRWVRCLRRAALHSCAGEDEHVFFVEIQRRSMGAL